jgi:hypothetical protein
VISFLERGKTIAWGAVPTLKDKIEKATLDEVGIIYDSAVTRLSARGIKKDTILEQSMITPSCGTGSLTVTQSEKVMSLLNQLESAR